LGLAGELRLGNLEAERDWGFAGDYVEAMWRMLQLDEPGDYVIATGEVYPVWEMARLAFEYLELDYQDYIILDQDLMRPSEPDSVRGDPSRAYRHLGWGPSVSFRELVAMMVDADLERLSTNTGIRSNSG
jgi:GDPmannose 4,6-dehydratase